MKKIKLCVVGLLLSGVVYSNDTTSVSVDTRDTNVLSAPAGNNILLVTPAL